MIGNLNKKAQLVFLLFLPLMGLGQDFDFHDIKKIDSEESFKRFALENLFRESGDTALDASWCLTYGYKMSGEFPDETAYCWASFYTVIKTFSLQFSLDGNNENTTFEKIVNQIKSECTFFRVEYDRVYYSCPYSKYKGKIGFYITEENAFLETETLF